MDSKEIRVGTCGVCGGKDRPINTNGLGVDYCEPCIHFFCFYCGRGGDKYELGMIGGCYRCAYCNWIIKKIFKKGSPYKGVTYDADDL
jgi:hypothetical protein